MFAPACGPEIGGGHLLRDIALAQALAARGVRCTFALDGYGAALLQRFGEGCAELYRLPETATSDTLGVAVSAVRPEVLVLDAYALDARAVQRLGPDRPRVVVIDDLADRSYLCDLLVDPGYGRLEADYAPLAPRDCSVLVGPAYALLRPGFERPGAPSLRTQVERVFVSFGLSDVDAVAARAVARLRSLSPTVCIDVALAIDAPSVPVLLAQAASDPHLTVHPDAHDIAELMRAADVAVGAGGASTWERCALGLPSLAVIVADNQRRVVRALEADNVLLASDLHDAGFQAEFDEAWRRLQDLGLRKALATRAAALCDGRGAERVAEAILRL
jgi:UDP-2,4-diacetamido-2,4,6-trideoxy-beta-L-altropyranose hydrolase